MVNNLFFCTFAINNVNNSMRRKKQTWTLVVTLAILHDTITVTLSPEYQSYLQ